MSDTQLLTDIRAMQTLFAKDGTWTQGDFAKDQFGSVCEPCAGAAYWCLEGAMWEVSDGFCNNRYRKVETILSHMLHVMEPHTYIGLVHDWNDAPGRTIADVRQVIDAAISLAEKS